MSLKIGREERAVTGMQLGPSHGGHGIAISAGDGVVGAPRENRAASVPFASPAAWWRRPIQTADWRRLDRLPTFTPCGCR